MSEQNVVHLASPDTYIKYATVYRCPAGRHFCIRSVTPTVLGMDSFHISQKWSLAWEGVSHIMTFDLDLYLQRHSAMTWHAWLLKYVTSCVCSTAHTVLERFFLYLAQMITSMWRWVACNDFWPWRIFSRSFSHDFAIKLLKYSTSCLVHSTTCSCWKISRIIRKSAVLKTIY